MMHAPGLTMLRRTRTSAGPTVMLVLEAPSVHGASEPAISNRPVATVQAGTDPPMTDVHFASPCELGPYLLRSVRPDVILSPLICQANDVIEIAIILQTLGFAGLYRALAADLPHPDIVIAEVRAAAPRVDFDLFLVAPHFSALPRRKTAAVGRG